MFDSLKDHGLIFTPKSMKQPKTDERFVTRLNKSIHNFKKDRTSKGLARYKFIVQNVARKAVCDAQSRKRLEIQTYFWQQASYEVR